MPVTFFFPATKSKRSVLAAAMLVLVSAIACTGQDADTPVPTMTPRQILSEAERVAHGLTTLEFTGDVRIRSTGIGNDNGTPVVAEGQLNMRGEVVGEWRAPDDWVVNIEGFGEGTGLGNSVSIASNGERILTREDPEGEWVEIASSPVEVPQPAMWDFVFNLDMQLRSNELVVNGEPVYAFSGARSREIGSLPSIYDSLPLTGVDTIVEAVDLNVSKVDFQVRQIVLLVQTDEFIQNVTWQLQEHNQDIAFELPDELA